MRRTYRSKKETGGGLDPRDIIMTLDSKNSLFDAFYIQNIKQTKRELSIAPSVQFAASNKVRKRKYVKRLKEQEPKIRESTSKSVFLTPDKSFRVNKGPDLFDQLLNSSNKNDSTNSIQNNFNKHKLEGKTYCKRKVFKKKRNSYSSNYSTDSDKENSNSSSDNNITQNSSDILSHKLLIEENKKHSPKHDESIANIVKNISLFKERDKSPKGPKEAKNLKLPNSNKNSPLCSTPFLDKYRGKSIYNFSPIHVNFNDSCYIGHEINENKDNSLIVLKDESSLQSQNSVHENVSNSIEYKTNKEFNDSCNIRHETNKNKDQSLIVLKDESIPKSKKNEEQKVSFENKSINKIIAPKTFRSPILPNRTMNNYKNKVQKYSKRSPKENTLQTSELEPFLGFLTSEIPKVDIEAIAEKCNELEKHVINESVKEINKSHLNEENFYDNNEINNFIKEISTSKEINILSTEDTNKTRDPPIKESLEQTNQCCLSENSDNSNVDKAIHNSEFQDITTDIENNETDRQNNNSSVELSSSLEEENESLYNTCSSDDFDLEPVVIVERLNDSILQIYYEKMDRSREERRGCADYCHSSNDTSDSSNIENSVGENNSNTSINLFNTSEDDCNENSSNKSISSDTLKDIHNINENIDDKYEETYVSFVTTRRGKEVTNDSFLFDNSFTSASSSEFDKTVLSQNINVNAFNDVTLIEGVEAEKIVIPITDKINNFPVPDIQNIIMPPENSFTETETPRKSTITIRKNRKSNFLNKSNNAINNQQTLDKINNSEENTRELKQGIVLQPGKGWERSLSIYRRMTVTSEHFDQSILDESLNNKGRKYRQSVINTMEMQDFKGSVYNESLSSRRSTFYYKPKRSTIRIVKDDNTSRTSLCSTSILEESLGI